MYTTINDGVAISDVLAKGEYKVYYCKSWGCGEDEESENFISVFSILGPSYYEKNREVLGLSVREAMKKTHVCLGSINGSDSLEYIFSVLQGEVWSPNGEARDLIASSGLKHTSMSMGDVIETPDGKLFMVDLFGFKEME